MIKKDKFRMVKKRKSTVPKIDDGIPKCCFCHQPGLTKESFIHKFMTTVINFHCQGIEQ